MAKVNALTARGVAGNLAPGRYSDGGNLYLVVSKNGAKSWLFIYRFGGKQREMGLGTLDRVPLAQARADAEAARQLLGRRIDPLDHRAQQQAAEAARLAAEAAEAARERFLPFAEKIIKGYVEIDEKGRERRVPGLIEGYRNEKHKAQWLNTLRDYAGPIADMRLDEIEPEDVAKCIAPIWLNKQETASRVRGRIEKILAAATVRKLRRGPNPATWKGNLEALMPRRMKLQRGHHAAMPYADIPAFWPELLALGSVSSRALAFTILTAARTGETIGATWGEIDLDNAIWTIPGHRMKAGREHRVPLTDPALAILRELEPLAPGGDDRARAWVFPGGRKGSGLSQMGIAMCLRGLREGFTVHGFRSAFRDWASEETQFPGEVAEMALAHAIGNKVEAAYRRGDLFDKRRLLMSAWADHLTGASASNVIVIGSKPLKKRNSA